MNWVGSDEFIIMAEGGINILFFYRGFLVLVGSGKVLNSNKIYVGGILYFLKYFRIIYFEDFNKCEVGE